jgi:hypothetical protein
VTPRWFLVLVGAGCALAQSVRVYSEFQRVDPFGQITRADRAASPREILSPPLLRNAHTSFVVAVTPPPGRPYTLFIGQNPEHSVVVKAYRAVFVQSGDAWIPDGLELLEVAETGEVGAVAPQAPGQTTFVYWLDLWVDKDAPVRRTRLEIQCSWDDRWFIYPLELRILRARPAGAESGPVAPLAAVEAPSAETARAALAGYLCAPAAPASDGGPPTIRALIRRNVRQDLALARSLEPALGRAGVAAELADRLGAPDAIRWCKAPPAPGELGAEWYLGARDYLYRAADRIASADLYKGKAVVSVHEPGN